MILVLGLAGTIGSGKGTVAEYLKRKYGAEQFVYSHILSDILKRLHVDVSRENLQKLGKSLRDALGKEVLVNAMKGDLKEAKSELRLIDGIRYVNEAQMLKTFPHNKLIFIDAPEEVRYERVKRRAEKSDEGQMSLQEFKKRQKAATERELVDVREMADFVIQNTGTISDLHKKIDALMKR
jgi:dephospho-CoA kinase